jgi:RNA polymerase sigma-70 factor (ECF subfamily)
MENDDVFKLLDRIRRGDEPAFRQLYKAYSRKLYAYALRQLGDPGKAEEIVSDTLYEVWKHPDRFRGESQFSTWLIGVARNKILMAWRSGRREGDHEDIDEMSDVLEGDLEGGFDVLAQKQRQEGVLHCMERLGDEQRECIHLVFYEGLSLGEIAEVQGCPEGTVKTRLFHARQKLKNCLRLLLEREGAPVPGAPS